MFDFSLQFLASFLLAVGIFFIVLELRSKYDRSFLFFGISLILLCALAATDIWFKPYFESIENDYYVVLSERFGHAVATIWIPFSLSYIMLITSSLNKRMIAYLYGCSILLVILFFTIDLIQDNHEPNTLYYFTFAPYVLFYVVYSNFILIRGLKKIEENERKIIRYHIVAFVLLCISGLADLLDVINLFKDFPSYSIFGIFAYGLMAAWIFTERFLMLINEKQFILDKLQGAYIDLEEASGLKALGESSAIMSHQIRNYLHQTRYWSDVLHGMELEGKVRRRVDGMLNVTDSMMDYVEDTLSMARSHIIETGDLVNVAKWVPEVVQRNFTKYMEYITLDIPDERIHLYLQTTKIEQVLNNLIQNAVEAALPEEDPRVRVSLLADEDNLMMSIEDYGEGCSEEQVKHIFDMFYTSKGKKKGTGIGLALVKNVIQGHGGSVAASSKNLAEDAGTGMIFKIELPMYSDQEEEKALIHQEEEAEKAIALAPPTVCLIQEGLESVSEINDILNASKQKFVSYPTVQDFMEAQLEDVPYFFASPQCVLDLEKHVLADSKLFLLSYHQNKVYVVERDGQDNFGELTPSFVAENVR